MARVVLHEVGPRDGLQAEAATVPVETREAWIRGACEAGLDIVQAGSFVHQQKVPQMADTDALFRRLAADPPRRATLSALVLNEKGLERGLACGVTMFCMGVSASETHSRKNTGMAPGEATGRILRMARDARAAGARVQLSVQSAFGCGYEGAVPDARVLELARHYLDAGFRSISLADTAGHATPSHVTRLFGALLELEPGLELTCHFHDTYGLGMANVFAALAAGVSAFETSFGGLGGCPFTRLAAGNVATEDVVHAFQREGLRPDVDLARLVAVARAVAAHFGRELPGRVYRTGGVPAAEPAGAPA